MTLDAIIIGAGISGLVIAYRLKKLGCNVLLIESDEQVGGVMQTRDAEGFLIEQGPNSLRGTHEFLDLAEELDLMSELVTADSRAPAYVFAGDRLHAVPMSLPALIKTKLLSNAAKLRLLREPFVKVRDDKVGQTVSLPGTSSVGADRQPGQTNSLPYLAEESIAAFVRRRLGNEILEKLVAPFLSGVYAGDPEQLSVQACFPKLVEFEDEAGSLVRGAFRAARQARRRQEQSQRSLRPFRLCSFRRGLQMLPQRLARELGESLLTRAQVTSIQTSREEPSARFAITVEQGGVSQIFRCAVLVVATPAHAAAKLLNWLAPDVAALVAEVTYASLAAVPLAYATEQVARPLDGFGFLAPRGAGLRTLGSIWNSSLFAERAPAGWLLTTNFIGGATDPDAVKLSDEELINTVHGDLSKVLGITGAPRQLPITRYERAIPQYAIGHAARVAKLEAALHNHSGLRLAGNYRHGVAISDCIKQAECLAAEVAQSISTGNSR